MCCGRNTIHFTQKYGLQHNIPIPKGVTPFARTTPSWKHAFPGTPGMHTIELMIHNHIKHHKLTTFLHNLKYKVFCFGQKLPSVSDKLSVTHAEHLGQFRLT